MNKKLSFLLLAIFIIPLVSLFGCDDVSSYQVLVFSSWTESGSVSGSGTYKDGATVTLTATGLQGNKFVAWLYQGTTILVDGDDYTIKKTDEDSSGHAASSTLTFVMNENRQGKYTAVFSEEYMLYHKLSYFELIRAIPQEESSSSQTVSLALSHADSTKNVFKAEEIEIQESVGQPTENVTEALVLSTKTPKQINVLLGITIDGKTKTFDMRANLLYKQELEITDRSNYSYLTTYSETNSLHSIIFKIDMADSNSETHDYWILTLVYSKLGASLFS